MITYADHRFIFHKSGGNDVYFEASNQDTSNATYQYFGYISASGSWIIQRFNIQDNTIIYEYCAGQTRSNYDAVWNASGNYIGILTFTTFDQLLENL